MSEVSLGGLLILVVIRTIQYNIARMRVSRCLKVICNHGHHHHHHYPHFLLDSYVFFIIIIIIQSVIILS